VQVYTLDLIQCDALKSNSLPYLQSNFNNAALSDTIVGNRSFRYCHFIVRNALQVIQTERYLKKALLSGIVKINMEPIYRDYAYL
jgi:hypothetical protein